MKEATTLVPSGNGRVLFGEVAGATGGVATSNDGGATWTRTDIDVKAARPSPCRPLDRQERSMMFLVA